MSHLLVHHLPATYQAATMEMLRVLRRGGTARIFGYVELPGYFIADLRSQGYVVNTSSSVSKTSSRRKDVILATFAVGS